MIDAVSVIAAKRDGRRLSDAEIRWFIDAYTKGGVADEQASALLMAIFFNGLDPRELAVWTDAMIGSGDRMEWSALGRPTASKHSTGGVGDKVSLVVAPLTAACGAAVPKLSGRGLGHTGGTLDKLEAIPGMRVDLGRDEITAALEAAGCVLCAAGPGLAPADRKLYALRDVTATVESIPLIASSIMAKKIAEGAEALVLDVKVGKGAFMPDLGRARALAETMVELGRAHGVKTAAVLTAMDAPLGHAVGNALEVREAIEVLAGGGPADVRALALTLTAELVAVAGVGADPVAALDGGDALVRWEAMVAAQGGDLRAGLPQAPERTTVPAPATGFVRFLDARAVGVASWRLGAGRSSKDEAVSATAGVMCLAKPGDRVEEGQPVLELHADDPERFPEALEVLSGALEVGPEEPEPAALVLDRIT